MVSPSNIDEPGAAARVGHTLCGQWHLDRLIDVGGMAVVYAATHPDGTRSAIKILKARALLMPEVSCAFLREGHPNAVRVLDDRVDDEGNVCVVMELLEGRTLGEWAEAEGGRLLPEQVLRILDQLLEGLAALHEAGIVHRDIKPENLFFTTGGQVKILDFGIARVGERTTNGFGEPMAGSVMGTPNFMSPEQARGRWDLVDAQSDLWSVGATAFALLTGKLVHKEASLPELLVSIFQSPAPSLATLLPEAHPALVEIIDRSLERKRALRWLDARGMQAAVRAALRAIHGATPTCDVANDVRVPERTVMSGLPVVAADAETTVAPRTLARRPGRRRGVRLASCTMILALLSVGLPLSAAKLPTQAEGPAAAGVERSVPAPASTATADKPTSPPSPADERDRAKRAGTPDAIRVQRQELRSVGDSLQDQQSERQE